MNIQRHIDAPELFVPFRFFDKRINPLRKTARRPPLAKILQQGAQFRLIFFTVGTHIIKYFIRFVIKKNTAVLTAYTAESIYGQAFAEGILRTDKDDVALFQVGVALSSQEVIDIHEALVIARALGKRRRNRRLYFDIEDTLGIGNVDVEAYALAFVKRCYCFLQGGIFDFTDFDMQEPFDDAFADRSLKLYSE